MFTAIITTKSDTIIIEECSSYYYDKDMDTIRFSKGTHKEIYCFPYREILQYIIKGQ